MNFKVYMHIAPNNKKYVGITQQKLYKRWQNGSAYHHNKHFTNAILKYGWDNFEHIVIAENLNKEDACKLEQKLIKKYKTNNRKYGYNVL